MIFRKENWFNPLKEAPILFIIHRKINNIFGFIIKKNDKGIIFWIVEKIKQLFHLKFSKILITQKWNGNRPILKMIDIINILKMNALKNFITVKTVRENSIKIDVILWIKKKIINELSIFFLSLIINNGINALRFNSNPIQIPKNELEDKETVNLIITMEKKKIFFDKEIFFISYIFYDK